MSKSRTIDPVADLQRAIEEREADEQACCEHGAYADQFCEDCAENERRYWWQLNCGAHV